MSVLQVLGVILILASGSVLIPRVHIRVEYGGDRGEIRLIWRWLILRLNLRDNLFTGNLLFYKFRKRIEVVAEEDDKLPKNDDIHPRPIWQEHEFTPFDQEEDSSAKAPPPTKSEPSDFADADYPPPKSHKKIEFRIPRFRFGRKSNQTEPDLEAPGEDKYFWLRLLWQERSLTLDIFKTVIRSLGRFIARIRTDYFHVDLSLGTGDPMTTALAVGSVESSVWMLRRYGRFEIVPYYDERLLEFDLSCSFSMRPYQVVYVVLGQLVRLPWIRLVRTGWGIRDRLFSK